MKLYLFEFNDVDWDQYEGFTIAAKDEEECIKYLQTAGHYGEPEQWESGYTIKEIKVSDYKETTIILDSFKSG